MNDLYDEAVRRIDGYEDAAAVVERIERARRAHSAAVDVRTNQRAVIDTAIDEILAGGDVPDDLGAQVVAAETAATEASMTLQILDMAKDAAESEIQSVKANTDTAMRYLHDQLETLMAEVADAHRACGTIDSPDDAISAGGKVLDGWRTIQAAADRYDAIRRAQWELAQDSQGLDRVARRTSDLTSLTGVMGRAGLYANAIEWHPELRLRLGEVLPTDMARPGELATIERNAPWPSAFIDPRGITGQIWPTQDKAAFVRWLAAGPAAPWVPTMSDMRAKAAEIGRLIKEASHEGRRPETPSGWTRPTADDRTSA